MESSKCKKTAELCDKREYKEASLREILLINLHVFRCKYCREYSKKTVLLTEILNNSSLKSLTSDQKHILKHQISEELKSISKNSSPE